MVRAVTTDPAMLLFLNGMSNRGGAVNENYARELMELFTLGADRGAYTETDVRELARALTGWRADSQRRLGQLALGRGGRWDLKYKTVFGKTGRFTWQDAVELVLTHPLHPSFFVASCGATSSRRRRATDGEGRSSSCTSTGLQIRPVLEAIFCSPDFYEGPRMVKPPAVLSAGLLRASAGDRNEWYNRADRAGQRLYYPPDVSGWNDQRWLDTNTTLGRWDVVGQAISGRIITTPTGTPIPPRAPTPRSPRRWRTGGTRTSRPRRSRG